MAFEAVNVMSEIQIAWLELITVGGLGVILVLSGVIINIIGAVKSWTLSLYCTLSIPKTPAVLLPEVTNKSSGV